MRVLSYILLSGFLSATEVVMLNNGVRLEVESKTVEGNNVFLQQKNGMTVIVDKSELYAPVAAPVAIVAALHPVAFVDPSLTAVHSMIDQAAERHGLPAGLIHAVASQESGYQQKARSGMGAIGRR